MQTALQFDPANAEGLSLKALLAWRRGDRTAFAEMAHSISQPTAVDGPIRYLAAASGLLAGDLDAAHELAMALRSEHGWQSDAEHLLGLIELQRRGWTSAARHLQAIEPTAGAAMPQHAHALLGRVSIEQGEFTEAAKLWSNLTAQRQQAWGLTAALPMLSYLAGVQALRMGDHVGACEWFGKARELGLKEPRLAPLQERAAVLAARRRLESDFHADLGSLLAHLDRPAKSKGSLQIAAIQLLARDYRRQNKLPEAREVLRRITPPPTPILMELGMVAVQDQQLSQADECFAQVLQNQPENAAARYNLFWTKLSLGQTAVALQLTPELIHDATDPEPRRLLTHLQILMQGGSGASALLADMTGEEENRLIARLFAVSKLDVTVPLLCVLAGAARTAPRPAKHKPWE